MDQTFGVIFHPKFPIETLPEYARQAEKAGFDELWFWDDCFLPGALTASAIALSATRSIKVCIGLIPVPAYNPLFAAMEITSLARTFPGRFIPGFGHGVGPWMKQIGASGRQSIGGLRETVTTLRSLLNGEEVTYHGELVNLEKVQMNQTPAEVPPLYIGAMREKTLYLSGYEGDGTILTSMSSPQYLRWAKPFIEAGKQAANRSSHRVAAFVDVKVNPDGQAARAAARRSLADRLPWADIHVDTLDFAQDLKQYLSTHNANDLAREMPDEWLDTFAASGTPEQVVNLLPRWFDAGVNSIVIQPLWGDAGCLAEYSQYLMPLLKK